MQALQSKSQYKLAIAIIALRLHLLVPASWVGIDSALDGSFIGIDARAFPTTVGTLPGVVRKMTKNKTPR